MAWGKGPAVSAADGWVAKLNANDAAFTSLAILPFRPLTEEDVIKLCAALAGNTTLVELAASGKKLSAAALEAVAAMLRQNTALRQLSLGDATLGTAGVATLVSGLETNTGVRSIDFSFKALDSAVGESLEKLLASNQALTELLLSRNDLGDGAAAAMARGHIANPDSKLVKLDLGQTGLSGAICSVLGSLMQTLTTLILSSNVLGAEGGAGIGKALSSGSCSIELLELNGCGLTSAGADAVLMGVPKASKLRQLYLNDNGVTCTSAGSLNLALREGSLTGLYIKLNKELGDAAAEALELSKAATLQTLDVSQCGLTWVGAHVLLGPSKLSTLSLFGNQLAEGLDAALERPTLFTRATTLKDLDLSGNSFGDAGAFKLLDRLQKAPDQLPALAIIGLGANDCADKGEWHDKVQDFRMARQTVRVAWE